MQRSLDLPRYLNAPIPAGCAKFRPGMRDVRLTESADVSHVDKSVRPMTRKCFFNTGELNKFINDPLKNTEFTGSKCSSRIASSISA